MTDDAWAATGRRARAAAEVLAQASPAERTAGLLAAADALEAHRDAILAANAADLEAARRAEKPAAVVDRLGLSPATLNGLAEAVREIARLPDPVGAEIARWTRPNGLDIARVRTPIGVIAVIFESRPNVTVDAAALCLRAGNAAILRGGSDALRSCLALHAAFVEGLRAAGLPDGCVQTPPTADRDGVGRLLGGLDGAVDLIVPRGGRSLLERVRADARVPVLGHLEGRCHTYVHAAADAEKALSIVRNAKMRRTSVCGATETLLIDAQAVARLLPPIAAALTAAGCEIRADEAAKPFAPGAVPASEADWRTEHLAPVIGVRTVAGLDAAIAHVARYGSGHTDAIVTEDVEAAETFLRRVDSAVVLWNASTQFSDGGEFGFGGEIGIATDRLHARGPVGAEQLTTFKYVVRGTGQVRP